MKDQQGYNERLIRQGMEGEEKTKEHLLTTWFCNDTSDIDNYCSGHGPDIWKGLVGIEVKFWMKRFLDKEAFDSDVAPRLSNFPIKILIFLYEGSQRNDYYENHVKSLSKDNGVIPVVIDIEEFEYYKIEEMEERLYNLVPRIFEGGNNKLPNSNDPNNPNSNYDNTNNRYDYNVLKSKVKDSQFGYLSIQPLDKYLVAFSSSILVILFLLLFGLRKHFFCLLYHFLKECEPPP